MIQWEEGGMTEATLRGGGGGTMVRRFSHLLLSAQRMRLDLAETCAVSLLQVFLVPHQVDTHLNAVQSSLQVPRPSSLQQDLRGLLPLAHPTVRSCCIVQHLGDNIC